MSIRVLANDGARARVFAPLRFLLVVLALLVPVGASASVLTARLQFDEADLRLVDQNGALRVALVGETEVGGGEDAPLPMAVRSFYVPAGYEVRDVRVTPVDRVEVARAARLVREVALDPASGRRPFPAPAVAGEGDLHPARTAVTLGGGDLGGHRVESVAVFPVTWNRATGALSLARTVDLELELAPVAAHAEDLVALRPAPERDRLFLEAVRGMVSNPADVPFETDEPALSLPGGFAPTDLPSVEGSGVQMVIVTTDALAAEFQGLADWKTKKGVPTVIRTVEWIDANYPAGHDGAERVRMFLKDAWSKWGIGIALLGGDHDVVPIRFAWSRFFFGGTGVPTDQYYACLSGDWNADGDQYYGEGTYQLDPGDQVDLYPDLVVGRASVENATEAATFRTKSLTYEKNPPAGYVEKVCYLAEVLFPDTWEYGDPPGNITLDGKTLTDAFDLHLPVGWTRTKCYQSDNNLDRAHALTQLSTGHHHLMTLMNHGDAFKFSVGNGLNPLIFVADTNTLTNGDYLMFVMATACNPNQLDLECQGESFMNNPTGGAVAVMGPTREDFPLSASDYHESMLDLAFRVGITGFGAMNQLHRVPFIPIAQTESTPDRWTMMTKMLLGDPEIRFWTEEPKAMQVTHVPSVALGTPSITVHVAQTGTPIPNTLVCISDANGTYARGRTNAAGDVTLAITSSATGTVSVAATAKNYRPKESTFSLTAAAGAQLALTGAVLDDDAIAPSSGNGDGVVDAGETIEANLSVKNAGTVTANSVTATASIAAGSSATFNLQYAGVADPSRVFVGPDAVNPAAIPFTLNFAAPSIDYIGRPNMSFAADSLSDAGVYLWQDDEGWHLRWSTAGDSSAVTGTVTTDGKIRATHTPLLEATLDSSSLNGPATVLTFAGTTTESDLVDGVDFAMSDASMLTVTGGGSANLGNITAGATAAGTITFAVSPNARDGQVGYVDLTFTSTLASWTDAIPVVFAGPELEAYVFAIDDSNSPPLSGDGDGIVEVGETVRLTPTVLNRGTGAAISVDGAATAAAGITFVDAADAYGDVDPLAQTAGTDGYVFTVTSAAGTSIDLTLTDSLGRTTVKNIEFVAPAAPVNVAFESGSTEITVSWDPVADADLAGYNVYRSPTSGSGHTRVNYELLRTGSRYVDEGLALGSIQFYYLTAVDSSGNESPASAEIEAWTTIPQVGGFPKDANSNVFSGMTMADADNDGDGLELFVGSQDFRMYAWEDDGSDVATDWPVAANAAVWATPALGDLDGDNLLEVMWGAMDSRFYVTHHDGTPAIGPNRWIFDVQGSNQTMRGAPVIANVDADPEYEFLVGTDFGTLYGFEHDGTPLPGADSLGVIYTAPQTNEFPPRIWGPLAVGDLDDNGTMEIVFTCWNDRLYVIGADGTDRPGFPIQHPEDFRNGPSLGDLDNDGTLEIVAGNIDSKLYVWNHDGTSYLTGTNGVFADLPGEIRSQPALCQLDADPELEIVVTCMDGAIYAFNHDGSGFTQIGGLLAMLDSGDGISASPIVVDVDGDGDMEILVGHRNGSFYGVHHTGARVAGLPIPTSLQIFSTAAAGDIDNDGDVDVAFASYDESVNVLDFPGASTPEAYEWPTTGGNVRRTSLYGELADGGATDVTPLPGSAAVQFALSQNTPNPFPGGTSIEFAVPKTQHVTLRVYNVEGRLVRTLVDESVQAGRGRVNWDGRDAQGRALSSGVYFYRLDNGETSVTRKSVLLR